MSTQYAFNKIVIDGLVLALDAADRNSYPGSGTAWRDMSGNNNTGTLTNGPTFNSANGGAIVFDGTDDYVTVNRLNPLALNFSIGVWFKQTNFSISSDALISNRNPNVDDGWVFDTTNLQTVRIVTQNSAGTVYSASSNTLINTNQWYNAYITRLDTLVTLYLNGIFESSTTLPGGYSINSPFSTDTIGAYQGITNLFDGSISSIIIYRNKSLSASEVLQNYNAQKSRFGL